MNIGNGGVSMKRIEQFPVEPLGEAGGETAVDTQIEVDLICGGVGFDDDPADGQQWLKDLRNRQKASKE